MSEAVGHLLTFTTYGTHLHGHENGSVNRIHRNWGAPMLEASPTLRNRARCLMRESRFVLDEVDRNAVLDSVRNASTARRWHLYCVHVRTNHVHLVIRPNIAIDRARLSEGPCKFCFEAISPGARALLDETRQRALFVECRRCNRCYGLCGKSTGHPDVSICEISSRCAPGSVSHNCAIRAMSEAIG